MIFRFHMERLTNRSRYLICSVDEEHLGAALKQLKDALGLDVEFYADVPRDGHRIREQIPVPQNQEGK